MHIDHRLPAGAPGQRIGIGLIADQNPPLRPNGHSFRPLNQDTVFFDGIEKMALKFHMPVYFCRQRRLRRGYYELEFLRLYDGVEQVAPNEVTERYVRQLESDIVGRSGDVALVASPLETPSSAMSVVKIVILNWNGAAHLRRFLPSVVRTAPPGVEIVVADNGSTDGSAALVERGVSVGYVAPAGPENYGFAGGYDRALERLGGDYWVLLNSDVEPAEGWLEPLIAELDAQPDVAVVGAETALLRRARPVRVCGCCGRIHRLVRFPVLSGTYPGGRWRRIGGSTTTPAMSFG